MRHERSGPESRDRDRRLRGIGSAVSERLARDGFAIAASYAGNAEGADALVRKIEASGGRVVILRADVADAGAVARMFDAAEEACGRVDVLVNAAGTMDLATIADSDDALFERTVGSNLRGTFNTFREAARRLRDGGRIVSFSSSVTALLQQTTASTPRRRLAWKP